MQAGMAAKAGILQAKPEAEVVVMPLADGGEGTAETLIEGLGGERVNVQVRGPLGESVTAFYGKIEEKKFAVMEMASAAGITLISKEERNPLLASTYGVGEMISDAMENGCRHFLIGIGGSATNDGGIGMLKALGYQFTDAEGKDVGEGGRALEKVCHVDASRVHPLLKECSFRIACDVKNPLCGESGATFVFGPQKGVTEEMKSVLDAGMRHYAEAVAAFVGKDYSNEPGSGAAGGLGFAFAAVLGATLTPGIELVMEVTGIEKELRDADIVVTGEGRLDSQTAMGKAPVGVAKLAKKYGAKVIAFAGCILPGAEACNEAGIDGYFSILNEVVTLEEAMDVTTASQNLRSTVEQVFRIL